VFALPFAVRGVVFAYHAHATPWRAATWLWVVAAMVGARTAAMGFNRLVDHGLDALNPRTRNRELPRGEVSRAAAWVLTVLSAALFVFAASRLNPLCFALSPVALAIVLFYSLTKRFSWGSHFVLGLGLGIAPVGGWLAVTGRLEPAPFLIAAGVLTWIAGMDILYALQDETFDRDHGLHSVPVRFGRAGALRLAAVSHAAAVLLFGAVPVMLGLSPWYFAGLAAGAAVLVQAHRIARGNAPLAFDLNALFGICYLAAALAGVWL
jgi:4-hydroxybenzoate polyprenyltransferase